MASSRAQPAKAEVYKEPENPATKNPAERAVAAESNDGQTSKSKIKRGPSSGAAGQSGLSQSSAQGVRATGPADEAEARESHRAKVNAGLQNENEDAEQLATFAEGEVADAVQKKSGTQRHGDDEVTFEDNAADLQKFVSHLRIFETSRH